MKIHIVKKGESLYELAKKYHVELDALIAANPQIADPNVIDVGMKVKIPHHPKPVAPPSDYLYKHVVVQGDTLWKLGKAWGVPLPEMIAANPRLKNPNILMTGEVVYIPKLKPAGAGNPNSNANPKKADTSVIPNQSPVEAPPNIEMPVEKAPEMPHIEQAPVAEKPIVPEAPVIEKKEAPIMEKMHEAPIMEKMHVQEAPIMEKMHFQEAPLTEKPNFHHMPYEMPNIQQVSPFGEKPGILPEYTAPGKEAVLPEATTFPNVTMPPLPSWHHAEHGTEGFGLRPSHDLFMPYEVPATEAVSYGKSKEDHWGAPEPPPIPQMPSAAEMPYWNQPPGFAGYPGLEGPSAAIHDCGRGQPHPWYPSHAAMGYPPGAVTGQSHPGYEPGVMGAGQSYPGYEPGVMGAGQSHPGYEPGVMGAGQSHPGYEPGVMGAGQSYPGFDPGAMAAGHSYPGYAPGAFAAGQTYPGGYAPGGYGAGSFYPGHVPGGFGAEPPFGGQVPAGYAPGFGYPAQTPGGFAAEPPYPVQRPDDNKGEGSIETEQSFAAQIPAGYAPEQPLPRPVRQPYGFSGAASGLRTVGSIRRT
ncbi:LysM peptidoglycan-binding domain-containing protein [Paenibacillus sp. P25]|nr:LysM peptidoglycan-binding domain-containing protein [Paenibacillus sp. P25]